jgi:hypothetical protein
MVPALQIQIGTNESAQLRCAANCSAKLLAEKFTLKEKNCLLKIF